MYLDTQTIMLVITLVIVAYQAYKLHAMEKDMDDLVDKHNDFVESVATVFDAIIEKTPED